MKHFLYSLFLLPVIVFAQKKPLDHSVYDNWQSIGESLISLDGKWVVYTVTPQEGDATLYIHATDKEHLIMVPRGYQAVISNDNRFVVCKIKPFYKDLREARIRKKRPDDFPKDSLCIVELANDKIIRLPRIKSFKIPEKGIGWLAYQKEKESQATKQQNVPTLRTIDSLQKKIDSLSLLVVKLKNEKAGNRDSEDADDDPSISSSRQDISDVVLRKLDDGREQVFKNIVNYYFNLQGQKIALYTAKALGDSLSSNAVVVYQVNTGKKDIILKGGNDFRNFAWSEDGKKLAFMAERDTNTKSMIRPYALYVYGEGDDSAVLAADNKTVGMQLGMTVSENGQVNFSKSGKRVFFGVAPLPSIRDTSLPEIDQVKLDIWHYQDDYLMSQQLFQLNTELKRSYLSYFDVENNLVSQIAAKNLPTVIQTNEGDGDIFIGITDTGRRVESQWSGSTKKDVFALNLKTGKKALVKKNHAGQIYPSSTGRYILLYDNTTKHYAAWDGKQLKNITSSIKHPLYNEENDIPNDPGPYGIMGWHEKDSFVYVHDRYDVWKVDPKGIVPAKNITGNGRSKKDGFRYIKMNPDEKYFTAGQVVYYRVQNQVTKKTGLVKSTIGGNGNFETILSGPFNVNSIVKSKAANLLLYTKEDFLRSPDLYVADETLAMGNHLITTNGPGEKKLSILNAQQASYNWGSASLYNWTAFDGKRGTGILYKPEDFDSTKKYPLLLYFYEKLSDGLYNYHAPAPTPSRLNIPFFVSRGYLVLAPDISYTKGHPAKSAYNYIVSGAKALAKNKWVDEKNMGIQGQSWGGIQVAQLITMTNIFKAAWAGAPVVNMFSAYGGIRWESGNNRQFQYEKGQSRIGYTPWERPDLYIENSPFFHLQKITTPLVIMANDADGAVPWYQGIEFFTAMRRLNKKVWLLNYNGEAHNLVERKNRKDIQVREQEYFDWLLKGAKPAKWLTEGLPAIKKGKEWGLELVDE